MKETLIQTLSNLLTDQIEWIMLPVYYAGGTVTRDISSQDIITPLQHLGKRAVVLNTREEVLEYLQKRACPHDSILLMGARDPSLSSFAQQIANTLSKEEPK